MDHVVMPLFAIPLYISEVELSENHIEKLKSVEFKRIASENGDLSTNLRVLDDLQFTEIRNLINKHVEVYTKEILKVVDYINFEITNSWIVRHQQNDYAQPHIHVNSILSGILYIDVDETSGDLVFQKDHNYSNLFPPAVDVTIKERNIFNSKTWSFTPKKNQIYIFPSNLSHSVNKCDSENLRYCLAFNLFPKGTLGLEHGEPMSILNLL